MIEHFEILLCLLSQRIVCSFYLYMYACVSVCACVHLYVLMFLCLSCTDGKAIFLHRGYIYFTIARSGKSILRNNSSHVIYICENTTLVTLIYSPVECSCLIDGIESNNIGGLAIESIETTSIEKRAHWYKAKIKQYLRRNIRQHYG